ncbi:TPA: phosphoglycerate dehydrogenase [bacterium]|nr:phosphoglycerate dehydrogenase [bacterium]
MGKVLVADPLSQEGLEVLNQAKDLTVDIKTGLKEEEIVSIIGEYHGLIVRSETKVTAKIIDAATNLQVIGRAGVGVDNINVDAATKKGIVVMNAPSGNTVSTAEHTLAMMLALSRNIPLADASMKREEWDRKRFKGVELAGKTLGIVGLGRIGSYVAKLALAFNMKVIVYDPFVSMDKAKRIGVELVTLDEIYRSSDYITFHTPLSEKTTHMVSEHEFKMMKPGIRIINCARGGIIDEEALFKAIEEGKVAGCALDVYEHEPPRDNPLIRLDRVVCVPHLGASTIEAQINVGVEIAEQMVDALRGGPLRNAVNIRQVEPEVLQEISPYLDLVERIGRLHVQLQEGQIEKVELRVAGEIASYETTPFTTAFLKGMLGEVLGEGMVNYVNAPFIAKERGIEVDESKESEDEDFANLVSVKVKTDCAEREIEGSIFQKRGLRIVSIDGFRIDAIPYGDMLVISNVDKPGVVGKIGVILGDAQINIAGLQMGRSAIGGRQLIVLNLDQEVNREVLDRIVQEEEILKAKLVKLR